MLPYATMSIREIMELPVKDLAAENSILFLWTTNTHIHHAFHVIDNYGFEYKTLLTWVKNARSLGSILRSITEHCLIGVRGKPFVHLSKQTTVIYGGAGREHSKKCSEFYGLVESLCPQPDKLEMFARGKKRKGWDVYGLEILTDEQ